MNVLPPIFQQPVKKLIKKKNINKSYDYTNESPSSNVSFPQNQMHFPNHNRQGSLSPIMNITMNNVTVNNFNATKRNFPNIKKTNEQMKKM